MKIGIIYFNPVNFIDFAPIEQIYHVQNVWELLIGKLCSICKDLARCHTIYV
jgi:hypothetical protein